MFARLIAIAAVAGTVIAAAGLLLVFVGYARNTGDRKRSENSIRQIGFGLFHATAPGELIVADKRDYFPAGAVANPQLAESSRLGWTASVILCLDRQDRDFQPKQDTALTALWATLDPAKAWDEGANRAACLRPIRPFQAMGSTAPQTDAGFATTNYVGNLGLYEGDRLPRAYAPNRRGIFNLDGRTPFAEIKDGLESTIAFAETDRRLGPWLQADSALRGWNAAETDLFNAADGLGGLYAEGAYVGMAAGQFRFLTLRADVRIVKSLLTIDGSENID